METRLPVHRYVGPETVAEKEDPNLRLSIAPVLEEEAADTEWAEVGSQKETMETAESFAKTMVQWIQITMLLEVIQVAVDHTMMTVNQPENPVAEVMEDMVEEEEAVVEVPEEEEEVVVVMVAEVPVEEVVVLREEAVEEDMEGQVVVVLQEAKEKEVSVIFSEIRQLTPHFWPHSLQIRRK